MLFRSSRAAIKTAEVMKQRGIVQIDCPVSGGVGGAGFAGKAPKSPEEQVDALFALYERCKGAVK